MRDFRITEIEDTEMFVFIYRITNNFFPQIVIAIFLQINLTRQQECTTKYGKIT